MTFGPSSLTIIDTDAERAHIDRQPVCIGRCAQLSADLEAAYAELAQLRDRANDLHLRIEQARNFMAEDMSSAAVAMLEKPSPIAAAERCLLDATQDLDTGQIAAITSLFGCSDLGAALLQLLHQRLIVLARSEGKAVDGG